MKKILLLIIVLGLTACKKKTVEQANETPIIGKWTASQMGNIYYSHDIPILAESSKSIAINSADNVQYQFNTDGTYTNFYYSNGAYQQGQTRNTYSVTNSGKTISLLSINSQVPDVYDLYFLDKNTLVLRKHYDNGSPTQLAINGAVISYDSYVTAYQFNRN